MREEKYVQPKLLRAAQNAIRARSVGSIILGDKEKPEVTGVVGCKERGRQVDGPLDHSTHDWKGTMDWPVYTFPANKKENRGAPALCVSGNFQGKQRVFGAPFWKLASFPESESWSGAKSEAKLRKSTKYPGGRRVNSRYTRVLRKIPGILPIWPKIWLILGPNQPQTRLRARKI